MKFVMQPSEDEDAEAVLGRRLRELRVARGWSQEDVASEMRARGWTWHQTTCAKTEAGGRPIRVNESRVLAEIFGLPLAELVAYPPVASKEWLDAVEAVTKATTAVRRTAFAKEEAEKALSEAETAHNDALAQLEKVRTEMQPIIDAGRDG